MTHQKHMFAVSTGTYSDYRILCVTDSEKRAKRIVKQLGGTRDGWSSDARVESLLYLDREQERVVVHSIRHEIRDNDADTEPPVESSRADWEADMLWPERNVAVSWRWVRAPCHRGEGGRLEVDGTDLEAVRKVASDRAAALRTDDALRARQEAKGRA